MFSAPPPNLVKGCLYITAAFFFLAIFGLVTREASEHASKIWVSWLTYVTAFILALRFALIHDEEALQTKHFPWHLGRAVFGVAASFLYMLALQETTIVDATLLFNTAPLFLPLLAATWLHAFVSIRTWLAVLIGFIGIIFIIKPNASVLDQPGDLLGLASGLALAIAFLFVRRLAQVDSPTCVNVHFFGLATLLQLPFLFFFGSLPTAHEVGLAIIAGIAMAVAQAFLVTAYSHADASQVGVFQYSMVLFVGIIDWLIGGPLPPLSTYVGALFIVLAGFIVIRSGSAQSRPYAPPTRVT